MPHAIGVLANRIREMARPLERHLAVLRLDEQQRLNFRQRAAQNRRQAACQRQARDRTIQQQPAIVAIGKCFDLVYFLQSVAGCKQIGDARECALKKR